MRKKLLSVLLTLVMIVSVFGSFSVIASAESAVAQVILSDGTVKDYPSLEEAWKAAVNSKATFKLLSDWRVSGNFGASEETMNKLLFFNGGALSVPPSYSVTIDLNGHNICRDKGVNNMTDDGSVIRLFDKATLTINDTSEKKNGSIEGGSSNYGGGIYAPSNNTVTMNGGKIRLCNGYYGGGVYLDSSSTFIMNGGKIEQNTGYYGGGIYAEDEAVLETHGGAISENRATADGGGIYLWSAQASLNNCSVTDNKAKNGGAIYADYNVFKSYATLEVINTKIMNNTADKYYGGIYFSSGRCAFSGETRVKGNRCGGNYGGGVYLNKNSIAFSGNVQIYGNYANGVPRDVWFGSSRPQAIYLEGGGIGVNAMIGIYAPSAPEYLFKDRHISGDNCKSWHDNATLLKESLFSNEGKGFTVKEETDYHHDTGINWHNVTIEYDGSAANKDVKVTQVRYKGVLLSPSEYSSDYDQHGCTITLKLPDFVLDTSRLQVKANIKDGSKPFDEGHEITFDSVNEIFEKLAIAEIYPVNRTPDYTVTVEGGTVDGEKSATKKYLELVNISPTVPEGMAFSHWEVDYSDITGFEAKAKSPANMVMPKHDVTFTAVFKEKVSRVDIVLDEPKGGELINSHATAKVTYTIASGTTKTEDVDVAWKKHVTDRIQDKFDFNTLYDASFSFSDSPEGDFRFADANELKIYLNGTELLKENYKYLNQFEKGGGIYGAAQDSDPVKQHWVYITYPYQTDKAKVLSVDKPKIEINLNTSVQEIIKLLPDSVGITYEGMDGVKSGSAAVSWDTASLPSQIQNNFTINGTVTMPENLSAGDDMRTTSITVSVVTDKQRLQMPSASIQDGASIAPNTKITLTSSDENAKIWYKIDDGAFTEYDSAKGIVPAGEAGKIVDYKITAYCTADGFLQSEFLTLNLKVDNESVHTVKIVDKNGASYNYATGSGEYKIGDTVTIEATESDPDKFVTGWSTEGITLTEEQKTASEFTFTMPSNDVTITAASFRYYVSKLYLSSITPIAGNALPQMPEIACAEDVNRHTVENAPLVVELMEWQEINPETDISTKIEDIETYKTVLRKKYRAIIQIKPRDGVSREASDDFTVYVDGKEYSPYSFLGTNTYFFYWDFTAVNDELTGVDLGDSITVYTGNSLPGTVGVTTKYSSIEAADIVWTGSVDTSSVGSHKVTANITLPDNVIDTNNLATKEITINVRDIINRVKLTTPTDIPVKSGNALPTEVSVASDGASLVENSFSVTPNNATANTNTEYIISAKVAPAENCEFGANPIFTINGISMNASPAENGEYELTYTFTAQEVQSYEVIVNGGESQTYNEGDRVEISTSADGFYKWTAETVYETTETVIGDNNEQKEITVTHRKLVNIFTDGDELKAATSFVMPKLADGSRLEITANKAHGIIDYDKQTMTANIVADKAYKGIKIIFATYSNGELALVKWVDTDLAEGFNTVTAPEDFTVKEGNQIKVMVWENFDSIKPLFEAYEE